MDNLYVTFRLQMERQRVQAGVAGVASVSHTVLYHQFIVSICAYRAATEVRYTLVINVQVAVKYIYRWSTGQSLVIPGSTDMIVVLEHKHIGLVKYYARIGLTLDDASPSQVKNTISNTNTRCNQS